MKRKAISRALGFFLAGVVTLSSAPGLQVRAEGIENAEEAEQTEENTSSEEQEEGKDEADTEEVTEQPEETGEDDEVPAEDEEEEGEIPAEATLDEEEIPAEEGEIPAEATLDEEEIPAEEGEIPTEETLDEEETAEEGATDPEAETAEEKEFKEVDLSNVIVQAGGFAVLEDTQEDSHVEYHSTSDSYAAAKKRLIEALLAREESLDLTEYGIYENEIDKLFTSVVNTKPELFYVGDTYGVYANDDGTIEAFYPSYNEQYDESDSIAFRTKAQSIVDQIDDDWTDLEKVLFLHDYVVQHVEYEKTQPYKGFDAYTALMDGEAVCNGYALEYTYLLTLAGIESEVVVSDTMRHAWNLVRLEGRYYYVDTTWDDHLAAYTRHTYCGHDNFLVDRKGLEEQDHYGSDWYGTKTNRNVYDNVEAAGNYAGYFWKNVECGLPLNGTETAYCNQGKFHIYDFASMQETAAYDYEQVEWPDIEADGYTYVGEFTACSVLDGVWYYTVPDGIFQMTEDGESERVYTLTDTEKASGRIYGMMQENGKLYYELAKSPYASTAKAGYFSGATTARVQSVTLSKTSASLAVGGTVTLKATIEPANATNKNVRWSSSNEAVATVSDGVVTAKAAGTAIITVTTVDGDKKATCTITATANGSGTDITQEQSTRGFVYRMYDVVLDREPDAGGLDNWVERLDSGESTAVDIVYGFFCSPEYNDKGKSNSELVTDCYNAMLSRDPDPSGYDHWTHCLEIGMTREAIFAGFVNSPEFVNLCGYYGIEAGQYHLTAARDQNYERTYFIYRLYQNCLGRTPDVAGLENWCANLMNGMAGSTVANGFIFSPEYWDKHTDNTEFVSMLYQTILGREGEAAGMSGWIELLNYTSTREKVLNGFLFSEEFAQQCAVAGIQVGERIAEPDEGKAWQYNIQVLALCNQQRKANGLENLVTREDLWRDVAMVRAAECTESFSHTRPNGTDCWTAYTEAGVKNASAENIAAGYSTPKSVVNGWMKSSGHKANILGNSKVMATGYCYAEDTRYGHYWSQNFTR